MRADFRITIAGRIKDGRQPGEDAGTSKRKQAPLLNRSKKELSRTIAGFAGLTFRLRSAAKNNIVFHHDSIHYRGADQFGIPKCIWCRRALHIWTRRFFPFCYNYDRPSSLSVADAPFFEIFLRLSRIILDSWDGLRILGESSKFVLDDIFGDSLWLDHCKMSF